MNKLADALPAMGRPIGADTVEAELGGTFKNGSSDYRPNGQPRRVVVGDFVDEEAGKVAPRQTAT